MKIKIFIIFLVSLMHLQFCKAQQTQAKLTGIENYTKGKLIIKVTPFGLDNPITVGEIKADGTIHFNWSNNINFIKDPHFFMSSIKNTVGMTFCNDKEIEQSNEEAIAVESGTLFLYKNGQLVGALFPATQKEIEGNIGENRSTSLVLGSTISWFYSDSNLLFKAKCSINNKRENVYDFKEVTDYTIHFKKGWNMVLNTLVEKEDWKNETKKGSLPKTIRKESIERIPITINWYVKYWAK